MFRLTAYLTLIWAITLPFSWPDDPGFFYLRRQLVMLTGILGLGYMAAAMLLAIRPAWLENRLNGLDKMYRSHKHLGIAALIALTLHWLACLSAKWLVQAGLLERPQRPGMVNAIEGVDWHTLAKSAGEWGIYLFMFFAAVSLIQAVTYKKFVVVHKLAGPIFLISAFHSVLLLDFKPGSVVYDIAAIAMCVGGVYCAGLSLSGLIGKRKKVGGRVAQVEHPADNTVNFTIQLNADIQYHPGQFVYLNFHDGEPAHPFTAVNYNRHDGQLEIAVKALGDYTGHMVENLQSGQAVEVEGGYGQFLLPDSKKQVWVGAGIGITPFVAWLESMAAARYSGIEKIVFFYCAKNRFEAFFAQRLRELSRRFSNLELRILLADEGQVLTPEEIMRAMDNETDYSVSFCGPTGFAESLKAGLSAFGWPKNKFHHEIFKMR